MAEKYELLGKKVEDMPTSLNYEVESIKDVRGMTYTSATKGAATTEINTVIIGREDNLAMFLDEAVERELELSELEKEFLVVRLFKKIGADYATGKYAAYKQKAIVVPDNYASENSELKMSATLNWINEKTHGTFDPISKKFEAESAPPTKDQIHYKDGDAARQDYQIFYIYDDVTTFTAPAKS